MVHKASTHVHLIRQIRCVIAEKKYSDRTKQTRREMYMSHPAHPMNQYKQVPRYSKTTNSLEIPHDMTGKTHARTTYLVYEGFPHPCWQDSEGVVAVQHSTHCLLNNK